MVAVVVNTHTHTHARNANRHQGKSEKEDIKKGCGGKMALTSEQHILHKPRQRQQQLMRGPSSSSSSSMMATVYGCFGVFVVADWGLRGPPAAERIYLRCSVVHAHLLNWLCA